MHYENRFLGTFQGHSKRPTLHINNYVDYALLKPKLNSVRILQKLLDLHGTRKKTSCTFQHQKVTKKFIVSHLGKVYDHLGIVSPTMAEGKIIYREACDETKSWDAEISKPLEQGWLKWTRQLRTVKILSSITMGIRKIKQVHLHIFANASNLACSCATIDNLHVRLIFYLVKKK
jgi:hypothetical protein